VQEYPAGVADEDRLLTWAEGGGEAEQGDDRQDEDPKRDRPVAPVDEQEGGGE